MAFELSHINSETDISNGVQFYWSQKKGNIARAIYQKYCPNGGVIFDPFLGAGSSLYGIRNSDYKFVGTELNELPFNIAKFNSNSIDNRRIEIIKEKFNDLKNQFFHYYNFKTESGNNLFFEKAIFDDATNPKIKKIEFVDENGAKQSSIDFPETIEQYLIRLSKYSEKIKHLDNPSLVKNSRIAVKEGMKLSDIFSSVNFYLLSLIKEEINNDIDLKFLLSSVLQLCKLTDTKSQSQFPYWIPKTDIVDRNIFTAMERKLRSLENISVQKSIQLRESFQELKKDSINSAYILNIPIQELTNEIPDESIDFVLTDPPYFDQVAYSEYLKIWEHFLGYKSHFEKEIIVSQREEFKSDEKKYLSELKKAFKIVNQKLKPGAKMVVYFKESRLDKMGFFLDVMNQTGFSLVNQEFIDSKKFTYKQNTSSKSTIKGESILILEKRKNSLTYLISEKDIHPKTAVKQFVVNYLKKNEFASLGQLYNDGLVKHLYQAGVIHQLKDSKSVVNIINEVCTYSDKNRIYYAK